MSQQRCRLLESFDLVFEELKARDDEANVRVRVGRLSNVELIEEELS